MGEASCPKATIVVPVYNSARSIQRCLDSLLAQSERSIQVVCVNDGSTDDSLNVLRQIAQADDRVLVIDQENAGVSCARNAGIDVAEGETVFFVDADDYIDAQTVERVLLPWSPQMPRPPFLAASVNLPMLPPNASSNS